MLQLKRSKAYQAEGMWCATIWRGENMASKEVKIDQWMKSKGEGGTIGATEEKKLKKPVVQVKPCNGETTKAGWY